MGNQPVFVPHLCQRSLIRNWLSVPRESFVSWSQECQNNINQVDVSLSRHTPTSTKYTVPPCANKCGNSIIGFPLPIAPISKISFSKPSHGLKEKLVVNRPDFGHPWKPHDWLSHSLLPLQTKFQVYGASRRGTCGTLTWSWF